MVTPTRGVSQSTPAPTSTIAPRASSRSKDGRLTNLKAISSGQYVTCALRQEGTIVCWGGLANTWTPPQDETFVDILVGWFQICALREDGTDICWSTEDGEVTTEKSGSDSRHPGVRRFLTQSFTTVSIGDSGVCAIRRGDGYTACLGDDGIAPVPAPEGERFTAIKDRKGDLRACAFGSSGSPVCWEYRPGGQTPPPDGELFSAYSIGPGSSCALRLEDGSPVCSGLLVEYYASPPEDETFVAISNGDGFACALREDGSPACWGREDHFGGEAMVPVNERFSAISSGRYHACALRMEDGSPVCWGGPNHGSAGQAAPPGGDSLQAFLPGDERVSDISVGFEYTCALRLDGSPICAGTGVAALSVPPEGETFTAVGAGYHYACALRQNGSPVCWSPRFPNGGVSDISPPEGERFTAISTGLFHTCGLREDGSSVCWTFDYEIKSVALHLSTEPIDPPEGERLTAISSGYYHTCGLREDGSPVCWIAVKIEDDDWNPEILDPPEGEKFIAISSGFFHTCALREDGSPLCWASVSTGDDDADWAPLDPPEGNAFTAIATGPFNTCALRQDGSLACSSGVLLDLPMENDTFTSFGTGLYGPCAWREDGSYTCLLW